MEIILNDTKKEQFFANIKEKKQSKNPYIKYLPTNSNKTSSVKRLIQDACGAYDRETNRFHLERNNGRKTHFGKVCTVKSKQNQKGFLPGHAIPIPIILAVFLQPLTKR